MSVVSVVSVLTELSGDLLLGEQGVWVDGPLEVLLQDGQDGGFLLGLPYTASQQHEA